jgi:hypothetical protein
MVFSVALDVRSTSPEDLGEELSVGEWMSVAEAAEVLEVAARTVQRSLATDDRRTREWGAENEGWRRKPLAERTIYQLRRSVVLRKAGRNDP